MKDEDVVKIAGKRLAQLRENANLSQAELAKRMNVSSSTIGMWELGEREIKVSTLRKIAEYFDVKTDYLTGLTDDPTSRSDIESTVPPKAVKIIRSLSRAPELDDEDYDIIAKQVEDIIAYAIKKKQPPKP
ncbi:helix-turn-helix domain-containing protein [Paenibacillus sp. 32352]|uniref:helix-turn-helix domain-containing protein n=1 Tax=Paenibacillus sp. 32352 TaxID=1969111 RepID=UPI0009ACF9FE|nr:helix-turn-helix transcriptional regulator [Paenibacillus sp. 32352]